MTAMWHGTHRWIFGLSLIGLLWASPSLAVKNWSFDDPHDAPLRYEEGEAWKEQKLKDLPPFPVADKLLEIQFEHPGSRFRFFIDPASLTIGKDRVVHYTLVLESNRSGNRNIMYEGMRCATREYKTLAYGTKKGEFRPLGRPKWLSIDRARSNWFRRDLWEFYLCRANEDADQPKVGDILDSIKYFRGSGQSFSQ